MYRRSIKDPTASGRRGKRIDCSSPSPRCATSRGIRTTSRSTVRGRRTNAAYNCIDAIFPSAPTKPRSSGRRLADESKLITYAELYEQVNKFANVLYWHGVRKGDRVTIYMR